MVLSAQELESQMPDATQLLSHEPEMASSSSLHYVQLALLVACLERFWSDRSDFFIGANLTIYFSRQQLKNEDTRGPDFFLVKDTSNHPRTSWVVWEENGQYPNLIIELLSPSTATTDRTTKKTLYSQRFGTSEYFWFSPDTLEFEGFWLNSNQYVEIAPNDQGWRWSQELDLYLGIHNNQLRYFDTSGQFIPTPDEAADLTQQQVELEAQRAKQEAQRAERLAQNLRELGVDPEQV